jgi:hypothetical protein
MIDIASIKKTFAGGILLNDAVANARGLVLQNPSVWPPHAPLECRVSPRAWLATDTHQSRSPTVFASSAVARVQIPIDQRSY